MCSQSDGKTFVVYHSYQDEQNGMTPEFCIMPWVGLSSGKIFMTSFFEARRCSPTMPIARPSSRTFRQYRKFMSLAVDRRKKGSAGLIMFAVSFYLAYFEDI